MKYYGIIQNDLKDTDDITVTLILQGCPAELNEFYNKEFRDYEDGNDVPEDIRGQIVKMISANNVTRNFYVTGGEPFYQDNIDLVFLVVSALRAAYNNIKITIDTKYYFEDLLLLKNDKINQILKQINYLNDRENKTITLDEIKIL